MSRVKFMSLIRNKKLLISLILFASTISLAGASTYSWFTAKVSSSGKIQVGTFRLSLNGEINPDENKVTFDIGSIQPGLTADETTFFFTNEGSLDMVLKADFQLSGQDTVVNNGVGDTSAYKVVAKVYKNDEANTGDLIYSTADTNLGENISNFISQLNNKLDPEGGVSMVFNPNEKLICKFQFLLEPALATNSHQGDLVTAAFKVNARQNVTGSSYIN
jgi:predicted ribosomally synthesized peptide with SipW-like signal peptide